MADDDGDVVPFIVVGGGFHVEVSAFGVDADAVADEADDEHFPGVVEAPGDDFAAVGGVLDPCGDGSGGGAGDAFVVGDGDGVFAVEFECLADAPWGGTGVEGKGALEGGVAGVFGGIGGGFAGGFVEFVPGGEVGIGVEGGGVGGAGTGGGQEESAESEERMAEC